MEHINRAMNITFCINRGHNLKITAFIIVCCERLNRRDIRSDFLSHIRQSRNCNLPNFNKRNEGVDTLFCFVINNGRESFEGVIL